MRKKPIDALRLALSACVVAAATPPAWADCPDGALGVSRTLVLPREAAAYGRAQHGPLPLAPREVVLTFDDGPRPETTPQVLQALRAAYRDVLGGEPAAWRYPYLSEAEALNTALREQRITTLSVDVGIEDWVPVDAPTVLADRLIERLRASGGGIVLLHDVQDQTAAALPLLLHRLKDDGWQVVHLQWSED